VKSFRSLGTVIMAAMVLATPLHAEGSIRIVQQLGTVFLPLDVIRDQQREVEAASDDTVISCHHHMLRETTVASGDYQGVSRYPDGRWRHGRYHGVDGAPEGASYLYFVDDEPKAQKFEIYLAAHPGAVDLWLGGHTHTFPGDVVNGRSHVETKWGTHFVNCAQLSKYHSFVTCPHEPALHPGPRHVRLRCYLHDDGFAAQGWYERAERVLELSAPFLRQL
jgi:hypothetical protein